MAKGDGAGPGDLPDKGQGPLLLAGHGHQLHLSAAGLVEPVEEGGIRFVEVLRRLGPPLGVAEEGSLQVDAGALGAALGLEVPDGVHGRGEHLLLQGHGGGQVAGDAVGGVVVRQGLEALRLPVGEVLPQGPVGVHVHQTGDHVSPLGVQVRGALQAADGGDGAVKLDVPVHKGFADEYFPVLD